MTANIGTSAPVEILLPTDRIARTAGQVALVVLGTLAIAASAKFKVPLGPVDMSLQTLAIFTIAGLYGRRLATATILLYLAEGLAGFPVFQGTPEKGIGLAYMMGPTAGYLAGFVVMCVITGWAADRGYGRQLLKLFAAMLVAEIIMLALGVAWLATLFGFEQALVFGVGPFVLTDLLKVVIATMLVVAIGRAALRPAG